MGLMVKTKGFRGTDIGSLSNSINCFLNNNDIDLIDIKMTETEKELNSLIIYQEKQKYPKCPPIFPDRLDTITGGF